MNRPTFPDRDKLSENNLRRYSRYAADMFNGLNKLSEHEQGVTVFGSARTKPGDRDYKLARQLGRKLAKNGHSVITGGAQGIMEAANRGAYEAGGVSLGLNIKLPDEQHVNSYLTDSLEFNYFFSRKVMLLASAKAYVFFPGGFGTLDELSEVITLIQTSKIPPAPILLFDCEFWEPLDIFFRDVMQQKYNTISLNDRNLYTITNDIDLIVDTINSISTIKISTGLAGGYDI